MKFINYVGKYLDLIWLKNIICARWWSQKWFRDYSYLVQAKNSCFAANDYRFNLKNCKSAIDSCKTTIKTVRNMNNGVRATDDLPCLPKDFIILFSHLGTAKEFVRRGPQRFYQISGDIGKAYRKHLYGRSCQEMHVHNCEMMFNHGKDRNMARKVIKEVSAPTTIWLRLVTFCTV